MNLESLTKQAEMICSRMPNDKILGDYFIRNNPLHKKPWREFNYWNGWFAITKLLASQNILEIGTGFGQSTIALARGAFDNLKLLVSLDLGIYGREYAVRPQYAGKIFKWKDNLLYVRDGIEEYKITNRLKFPYKQFELDTQDFVRHPYKYPQIQNFLQSRKFDLILIDGKHEDDGCYNDLRGFFRFGTKGCLIICDDLQCKDVENSFFQFFRENQANITKYFIWKFLTNNTRYPQGGSFRRDQGLIIKK